MENNKVYLGYNLDVLKTFPKNSIDSIVTDPPYGLSKEPNINEVLTHWLRGDDYVSKTNGFMGESWDSFVPGPSIWRECLRVLKPGADTPRPEGRGFLSIIKF
jgi:site-specific DNA-methyltransferase (adenine-specific)